MKPAIKSTQSRRLWSRQHASDRSAAAARGCVILVRVPFQQPEYERAFQEFVSDAVEAFVVADPILSQIHRVKVPEDPLPVQAGEGEVQEPQLIGAEVQAPGQQVLDGDAEALQTAIAVAAEQRIAQMKRMLYAQLAADPRNVINPGGQPLTWDLVLDNFEQREWTVDARMSGSSWNFGGGLQVNLTVRQ